MPIDLKILTIKKAHDAFVKGDFTSVELTQAYLDQIKKVDGDIHAYLEVFTDALDQAKAADIRIAEMKKNGTMGTIGPHGEVGLLEGIPCAIKDNILIQGRKVTAASKILENYVATYDATVITKLKAAGTVFIGRVNMDEFAMGGSTEKSAYGPTKNPHDTSRVPGGSSGGSAAAVAGDMALFALGTDTGGSIRQPASFCGVVGIKPTYGRVSRFGAIAMGSSLDQIGPIAKTVEDCEIVLDAIKGVDTLDSTTITDVTYATDSNNARGKIDAAQSTDASLSANKPTKIVIGVPWSFLKGDGIDPAVHQSFRDAIEKLTSLGHEIKEIELPMISHSLPVYYVLMPAEVSSNMARFDGVKFGLHVDGKDGIDDYFETRRAGLGKEVIRRILLGTYVLSSGYYDAYYNRANAVRALITEDFNKAFESVDVIITPTTPSPAFKIGEKTADPLAMYLEDIFTVTANLTGMPAISIPCGIASVEGKDLPLGLQLTARHGDEKTLFMIGKEFAGE